MGAAIEQKKQIVSEIKENFKNASSVVFVDYRGITVTEDTVLRRKCTDNEVVYRVYKNNLIVRALNELGVTNFDPKMFEGTTSVAFGKDEVTAPKILCETMKEINKMQVKFGYVNGELADANKIEALSKIPSKPVLVSMLLGVLQGPVSALARALNEISKKQA